MKNQIVLKYHIEVDGRYFEQKYGLDWAGFSEAKKSSIWKNTHKEINDNLAGVDNAMNSVLTQKIRNDDNTWDSAFTVTPIDDKIKSGVYIEDSHEASTHILNAIGLDPTLAGNGPGSKFGSGSGSDKHAALNIFMIESQPINHLLLSPFRTATRYNGWNHKGEAIKWQVRLPMMLRSQSGKPQQSKPTDEPA